MRKKYLSLIFSILTILVALPARAETPGEYLVESFAGDWQSDGDAFGQPARTRMQWAYAMDKKFMQLNYHIKMNPDGDPSVFEGAAYYRLSPGDGPDAFWVDNSGDLHPIRMEVEGSAMTAHWGIEGSKQGRTRYELIASDEMEVTDWILTDNGWRQFNQNAFTRLSEKEKSK